MNRIVIDFLLIIAHKRYSLSKYSFAIGSKFSPRFYLAAKGGRRKKRRKEGRETKGREERGGFLRGRREQIKLPQYWTIIYRQYVRCLQPKLICMV